MGALRNCALGPKGPCWNPYSERGLDEFAVVSAELEAKRERLVAQLGSPLSLVRFEIGCDDRKWIPIIICPTLSKAEIRALRRAATCLIAEEKHHSSGLTGSEQKDDSAHNRTSTHVVLSQPAVAHAGEAKIYQIGAVLEHLLPALRRFISMASFSISIAADIVSTMIMRKWHEDVVPRTPLPSTKRPNFPRKESFTIDNPSAAMASSSHVPPLHTAPPRMPTKDISLIMPPHSLHVKAPTPHSRGGFCTAPSTPRHTRQITKPFLTTISLPKTFGSQDQAHHAGIKKDARLLTSVSLPRPSHVREPDSHKVRRSSMLTAKGVVSKTEREERSEKLCQALIGAGLVLGLGTGLVIGYIPAIVGITCWWYALPSLKKAMGDKRVVESHHQ